MLIMTARLPPQPLGLLRLTCCQNLLTILCSCFCDGGEDFLQCRHLTLALYPFDLGLELRWSYLRLPHDFHLCLPNFPTGLPKSSRSPAPSLFRSFSLSFRIAFVSRAPISSSVMGSRFELEAIQLTTSLGVSSISFGSMSHTTS